MKLSLLCVGLTLAWTTTIPALPAQEPKQHQILFEGKFNLISRLGVLLSSIGMSHSELDNLVRQWQPDIQPKEVTSTRSVYDAEGYGIWNTLDAITDKARQPDIVVDFDSKGLVSAVELRSELNKVSLDGLGDRPAFYYNNGCLPDEVYLAMIGHDYDTKAQRANVVVNYYVDVDVLKKTFDKWHNDIKYLMPFTVTYTGVGKSVIVLEVWSNPQYMCTATKSFDAGKGTDTESFDWKIAEALVPKVRKPSDPPLVIFQTTGGTKASVAPHTWPNDGRIGRIRAVPASTNVVGSKTLIVTFKL